MMNDIFLGSTSNYPSYDAKAKQKKKGKSEGKEKK